MTLHLKIPIRVQITYSCILVSTYILCFSNFDNLNNGQYFAKNSYRPGQPKCEYTMWKFQDFSAIQILREINVGHYEAPQIAILTIWAALNFNFWGLLTFSNVKFFPKSESKVSKIVKTAVFGPLNSAKIDFT